MALCRWVKAYLLAVVLLDVSLSLAAKEKIRVSYGGVKFNIIRFDDERTTTYKIRFKVDGETSTYKFNTDGDVTDVKVGDLTYEVGPTSVTDVSLTANQSHRSTKRALAKDNEETGKGAVDLFMIDRRRLYPCRNCEGAWDLMCSQGLQSVCKLVDFGSPFGDSAEVSISTVCDDFGGACSSFTADQTCEHQCEDEDDTDGACDPNPCNAGACSVDEAGGHTCSCPDSFGGMHCQTDTSNLDRFYIEILYRGTWTAAERQLVRSQADRWEKVITHVPCGGTETIPAGRLLIYAKQIEIDGVGSGLGYAGPDYVWYACPGVSIVGTMTFDVDDLTVLSELELELLYFHEMGHAIGFGLSWEACSTCEEDNDPEWTCPAAAAVYNDLRGASSGSAANIVEVEGSSGTRCGHWSETIFDDELMTGYGEYGAPEPLSKLTLASLEDIEYIVNSSMAEPYTLPAFREVAMRSEAYVDTERPDRAFVTTKYYVDSDGNVVKEKQMKALVERILNATQRQRYGEPIGRGAAQTSKRLMTWHAPEASGGVVE